VLRLDEFERVARTHLTEHFAFDRSKRGITGGEAPSGGADPDQEFLTPPRIRPNHSQGVTAINHPL